MPRARAARSLLPSAAAMARPTSSRNSALWRARRAATLVSSSIRSGRVARRVPLDQRCGDAQNVAQLADVARPAVLAQGRQGRDIEALALGRRVARENGAR